MIPVQEPITNGSLFDSLERLRRIALRPRICVAKEHVLGEEPIEDVDSTVIDGMHAPRRTVQKLSRLIAAGVKPDLEARGVVLYRPGGRMDWHTNSESPGRRYYFVYNWGAGSRFYYRCGRDRGVLLEPPGWHLKQFEPVGEPPYLWHAITADSWRLTIAYRKNQATCPYLGEATGEVAKVLCRECKGRVRLKLPAHACQLFGACVPNAALKNDSGVRGCKGCMRVAPPPPAG